MTGTEKESQRLAPLATLAALLVAACVPTARGPAPEAVKGPSSAPKTLIMGIATSEEPGAGGFAFGASGTGGSEPAYILHAGLTVYDNEGRLQPRVVERVPTVENGD